MKATALFRRRVVYSEVAFAELVLWRVPVPLAGSLHPYKYRLAYVVRGVCLLRYDNEAVKGDHRHPRGQETRYPFTSGEQLLADFQHDINRISREHRDA